MKKCNFKFTKERVEHIGVFKKKTIKENLCKLKLEVDSCQGSTSYYDKCDEGKCIFMR